jgi:hypothetical protein
MSQPDALRVVTADQVIVLPDNTVAIADLHVTTIEVAETIRQALFVMITEEDLPEIIDYGDYVTVDGVVRPLSAIDRSRPYLPQQTIAGKMA